jgi:hypothetical protein
METIPPSAKVGETVKILRNGLLRTTQVSFNGSPAKFTALSRSEIVTTVPAEAKSGYVTVTTHCRTLKSNVRFQVRP